MKKILLIALLILASTASAHQPRIVKGEEVNVENPEVSQAFYAELNGGPDIYVINSEEPFRLYVGILVPDIEGIDTDVSAVVIKRGSTFTQLLNADDAEWDEFYEPFGGDVYLDGPEFRDLTYEGDLPRGVEVDAGVYEVRVFSPDNLGKYVFVVGEKEIFPPSEIWNTILVLPEIKKYFDKSPWLAYWNYTGAFLLFVALIIGAIVWTVVYLVKRRKMKYNL